MGILRPVHSRYNAHFVFYKPIKISPIKFVALSRFFRGFIARLSSAKTDASNPNIYVRTRTYEAYRKNTKHFAKNRLTFAVVVNIFMHGKRQAEYELAFLLCQKVTYENAKQIFNGCKRLL